MTKKDHEKIIRVLRNGGASVRLVRDFANMLKEDNDRFDSDMFIKAVTTKETLS